MCILFVSISKTPAPGGYKLILASNRDELFTRPTNPAQFWHGNSDIIGGQDMEKGKEGGTWLALRKNGNIGTLLNILTDTPQTPDQLGRGFLVNDFLISGKTGIQYTKELQAKAALYSPFNFVAIELKAENGPKLTYYSSKSAGAEPIQFPIQGNDEVYAFGNSVFHIPFQKVKVGKEEMEAIAREHPSKANEESLINSILTILKSKIQHGPDPQVIQQAPTFNEVTLKNLTSKFVSIPQMSYGSRTHTIILVDDQDNVKYMEWTLETPVDTENLKWRHSTFEFKLE